MQEFILASSSPRRRDILTLAGVPFRVLVSDVDEVIPPGSTPAQAVQSLARQKAEAVRRMPEAAGFPVVAADTVVYLDEKILGKPHSRQEAFSMLSSLSGRTHHVFTGVCILPTEGDPILFCEETPVEFYPLSAAEIEDYIATGEPMDKAGAYGIQGRALVFVKRIDGDFFNVMGLPAARLIRTLRSLP